MIHYHGLPITPEVIVPQAMRGAHFFVSFEYKEQMATALECGASIAGDNSAFSRWRAGDAVKDWSHFYEWVQGIHRLPKFDFAVIPDVIDGCEEDNDDLIEQWPFRGSVGAPVWHLHESLERLRRLGDKFERVCLGSSGAYAQIGTDLWWHRMGEAMNTVCDDDGVPITKLHGLRMLDPNIVTRFPLKSADSTNIARNIGLDCRWNGTYSPPTKAARAATLRARIEAAQSPWRWQGIQEEEFLFRYD